MPTMLALFIHRYRWGYQIRGDERGFLEKAKEYRSLGVELWAMERRPSLGQSMGGGAYYSLIVGNSRLPVHDPIDLMVVVLMSAARLAASRIQKPMAVYAYNQDPENVVTGFVFKLVLRVPLVVVHHHISPTTFAPLIDGIKERRSRGYSPLTSFWHSIVPASNRFCVRHADIHLALSEATKLDVKNSLHIDDIGVVGNGLDTQKFRPLGIPKEYDAAFLGRLVSQKGVDTLIRAWSLVSKKRQNPRLVLIGGGDDEYRDNLVRLAKEEGVSDLVDFKGFVSDEEVVRLLGASRLFAFPSHKEGFAQAVSQAMACGLCCLLSDIPSLRENYGGVATFVPPDDPERLAASILRLLSDDEIRSAYGDRSREFVQRFSWRSTVEKELTEILRVARLPQKSRKPDK